MIKKLNKFHFTEFFGNFISRKSGQKCCQYNQNGKPLSEEIVKKFLIEVKEKNTKVVNSLTDLTEFERERKLITWEPDDKYTKLYKLFYFRNVFSLTDFIKELYELDFNSNLMQIPNIEVKKQELLKIELETPKLKGLSYKDLQLAFAIDSINIKKYMLVPIKNEDNYKKEIRIILLEDQNKKIMHELKNGSTQDEEEKSRFRNKYDSIVYNKVTNTEKH